MRILVYIGLSLLLVGCTIFSAELRYTPKNSESFYFPPLSEELKQKQAECIRLKNFPCILKPNDTFSDFANQWYSTHLSSMKEPILYAQVGKGRKTIRFTHLGTWSRPYSYRIDNIDGKIIGTYNLTNGLGGYDAGRRIRHKEKVLNVADWTLLISQIDSSFWDIQTHDTNLIMDGSEWILEVLFNEKYHVVTRNSPDYYDGKKYAELCKRVIRTFNK